MSSLYLLAKAAASQLDPSFSSPSPTTTNSLQSDGNCDDIVGQNLYSLWNAYGWQVVECNGHSVAELKDFIKSDHSGKPLAILAKTTKGKGVSFMENDNAWHHAVLKEDDYQKALQEIGGTYGLL